VSPGAPSARADFFAGLLTTAMGAFVIVFVLRSEDAPEGYARWATLGAGTTFFGIGLFLLTHRSRVLAVVGLLALLAAFIGFVGAWNALVFGSGPVECTRVISLPWLPLIGSASDLECRFVASMVALPLDAVAIYALVEISLFWVPKRRHAALKRVQGWVMMVGLAPIILVVGIVLHIKGDGADFRARLARYARAPETIVDEVPSLDGVPLSRRSKFHADDHPPP